MAVRALPAIPIPIPSSTARLAAALGVGLLAGLGTALLYQARVQPSDFDPLWHGARWLLAGRDPYLESQAHHVTASWVWPIAYPLPALALLTPLASMPLALARAAFVGGSFALLAYALTARGWWGLALCLSGPAVQAWEVAQWTPALTGAMLLPAWGWMLGMKPNLGIPAWLASPDRRTALRTALLVAAIYGASLLLDPGWPARYRGALASQPHAALILRPFGWLLVFAALRWREPAGRYLVAAALIPQTSSPYDALPLLALVATTPRRAVALAALSLVPVIGLHTAWAYRSWAVTQALAWPWTLGCIYLPALILLLRRPASPPSPSP